MSLFSKKTEPKKFKHHNDDIDDSNYDEYENDEDHAIHTIKELREQLKQKDMEMVRLRQNLEASTHFLQTVILELIKLKGINPPVTAPARSAAVEAYMAKKDSEKSAKEIAKEANSEAK